MPKTPLSDAVQPQASTPLARLIAAYNSGQGGPEGMTLLSILARQSDPRAQHWAQWEFQRRKDANNGGVIPEEIAGKRLPEAYISNEPQMPISFANRVQGQPMAPGADEAMMRDYQMKQLLSLGRGTQVGRDQALQNASNNLGLMWDKSRIDNKPMPAEYSYLGQRPGSIQNFIAKLVSADPLSPE